MAPESQEQAQDESQEAQDANISWDDAFAEAPAESMNGHAGKPAAPKPDAKSVRMRELQPVASGEKTVDLDFILDLPLEVSVEVGRAKMLINDLLQLNQGSVIELTKLVGEPFEVLVNEKLVARGEVVVVNERFGVRLTDIISPMERIEQLR